MSSNNADDNRKIGIEELIKKIEIKLTIRKLMVDSLILSVPCILLYLIHLIFSGKETSIMFGVVLACSMISLFITFICGIGMVFSLHLDEKYIKDKDKYYYSKQKYMHDGNQYAIITVLCVLAYFTTLIIGVFLFLCALLGLLI